MSEYEQAADEKGQEFANTLSSFLNCMGNARAESAAVQAMLRNHATLRQSAMRLFMRYIRGLAEQHNDPRCEASINLAKAIMALPEAQHGLPLI